MKRNGEKITNRRKHRVQLSKEEFSLVERLLSKIRYGGKFKTLKTYRHGNKSTDTKGHGRKRLIERQITFNQVFDTIRTGYIVEVHNNTCDDVRVVLRKDHRNFSVNVVVSLKKGNAITAFEAECNRFLSQNDMYQWGEDLTEAIPRILHLNDKMEVLA